MGIRKWHYSYQIVTRQLPTYLTELPLIPAYSWFFIHGFFFSFFTLKELIEKYILEKLNTLHNANWCSHSRRLRIATFFPWRRLDTSSGLWSLKIGVFKGSLEYQCFLVIPNWYLEFDMGYNGLMLDHVRNMPNEQLKELVMLSNVLKVRL